MAVRPTTRALAAIIVFAAAPALFAQSQSQPQTPPPCAANIKPTPQAPCTIPSSNVKPGTDDPFPFPGETSTPATPTPSKPPAEPVKNGADDPFPFPGETPSAPAKGSTPAAPAKSGADDPFPFPGETPRDSSGGGSSSSSSSSGDNSAPDDPEPPVQSTLKHPRPQAKPQTDDEREIEDLRVARFYRDKGNFNAVYLRSKDAIKIFPDDPEAHLMLAEAAQKLNKRDEAIAEYKAALQFDPTPEQKKTASHGLEELK